MLTLYWTLTIILFIISLKLKRVVSNNDIDSKIKLDKKILVMNIIFIFNNILILYLFSKNSYLISLLEFFLLIVNSFLLLKILNKSFK